MVKQMSNYPPGSNTDESPWNTKEPKLIDCADCEGTGNTFDDEDDVEMHDCANCEGTGQVEVDDED